MDNLLHDVRRRVQTSRRRTEGVGTSQWERQDEESSCGARSPARPTNRRLDAELMRRILFSIVALTFVFSGNPLSAQIQFKSGVDVTPAFEGWTSNSDGTFS